MDAKTKVTLIGPAKIDGAWHKAGDAPMVDAETLQQLQAAGVIHTLVVDDAAATIALLPGTELIFTQAEFDDAVAVKAKEMAGAAFDSALAELELEAKELAKALEAEKAAAVERAEQAEGRLAEAQTEHDAALSKAMGEARKTIDEQAALIERLQTAATKATKPPKTS